MTQGPQWARLPAELRARHQWLIAGADKAPLSIDAHGNTRPGSSTDRSTWLSFEQAAAYAYTNSLFIGYVLSHDDPFACIDFDVVDADAQIRKGKAVDESKWTTPHQFNRYWGIVQYIGSYTETSTYGKGLHIWVRGKIGPGCKRDGIEVYSQERFIICTGAALHGYEQILDKQDVLDAMVGDMRAVGQEKLSELVEIEEVEDDETIFVRGAEAENGAKFNDLCAGRWEQYGFPSQSEADLALMSMFTFYSPSNEQCRRMFRMTALGKREKASKNNRYLDYTLKLIRARQAREAQAGQEADVSQLKQAASLISELNIKAVERQGSALHVVGNPDRVTPPPAAVAVALAGPTPPAVAAADKSGIQWPPGLAGELAKYVYQSAPRPVKEVAIVAALGFLAGVCGKAYTLPQSGLNIYMILIARSAVGKEAMHSGISGIMKGAANRAPGVFNFVNFNDMVSGQALTKACLGNQSFVNVAGEWGRKLKRIAQDDGREGPMSSLRTVMTNLYQKSGPMAIVGGMQYSDQEKDVQSVSGVAYSMIGETTPNTFYECLTESMMEDGFLSRFTMLEYDGDRPPLNTKQVLEMPQALGDAVGELVSKVSNILGQTISGGHVPLGRTDAAAEILWSFEQECDKQINGTKDEAWRQMWNRASLKVMRIAGLLAVGTNWMHPVIDKEHVDWALDLIRRDIRIMSSRIESGDVGTGDHARERKVAAIMAQYLREGIGAGYKVPETMRVNGIIPHKYLQVRTARISSFTGHKLGATNALDQVVRSMIASGYIIECKKDDIVKGYDFHGKCYRVLDLPGDAK